MVKRCLANRVTEEVCVYFAGRKAGMPYNEARDLELFGGEFRP